MNLKEYFARAGSHISDQDAQIIGPELEQLGDAKAEDIVNAARPETAVLHKYFEWDDSIAAEEFRKSQARSMAASIVIKVIDRVGKEQEVRAFYAVRLDKTAIEAEESTVHKHYVQVNKVRNDHDLSEQVIQEAKRQLASWKSRYSSYRELFPSFDKEFGEVFQLITKFEMNREEVKV